MTPREHVETLCLKLGVRSARDSGDIFLSRIEAELLDGGKIAGYNLYAPNPDSGELAYFICLHELGHIATGQFQRADYIQAKQEDNLPVIAQAEIEAWQWAFSNAILPVTPNVIKLAAVGLRSYGVLLV